MLKRCIGLLSFALVLMVAAPMAPQPFGESEVAAQGAPPVPTSCSSPEGSFTLQRLGKGGEGEWVKS